MNTGLEHRARSVLLLEFGGAAKSGWAAALTANQFDVHTIPDGADPVFATALLQASGMQPSLMIATLGYFAGRNRNPYQFIKQFVRVFPETVIVLVQPPGQAVTEPMRAVARRYGAADLVPALQEDAAATVIEMLWFTVCAQGARDISGSAPPLPIEQQVAAQLRRQLTGKAISNGGGRTQGAFRASDALVLAEKFSVSTEQLTQWLDELMQKGALRSLAGEKHFVAGDGLYRFFTDEPASMLAAGSVAGAAAAGAGSTASTSASANQGSAPSARTRQSVSEIDVHALVQTMREADTPLDIRDRSYRLTKYPKCFVGSEAVDWLVKHQGVSRPQAVKLGERMFESGLFHHVADDHDFKDGNFYFRFFADEAVAESPPGKARALDIDTLDVQDVATRMRGAGGVEVSTRRYLLRTYLKCFVGTEAVDWISASFRLSRPLAVKVGERMVEAGIVHHVTDDHDFKDGEYFYRYYADE